jgi:hypothetical protein
LLQKEKIKMEGNYTQQKIDAFWKGLDIGPVNKFFSDLLQVTVNLKKKKKEIQNRIYYTLEDKNNIADKNPITNAAWKKMIVDTFGSWMTPNRESREWVYSANIHLYYEHHCGGSNGADIGYVEFKNGKWEIYAECQKEVR